MGYYEWVPGYYQAITREFEYGAAAMSKAHSSSRPIETHTIPPPLKLIRTLRNQRLPRMFIYPALNRLSLFQRRQIPLARHMRRSTPNDVFRLGFLHEYGHQCKSKRENEDATRKEREVFERNGHSIVRQAHATS